MDEWIDHLDAAGNYTGKSVLKSEAHLKGLFHPTVHIWFYTDKGEILLQQRTKIKRTFPGLWDVSVAGHVGAGEEIKTSALREVQEEIGLTIQEKDLKFIGVFKSVQKHNAQLIDCEFHHTFLCPLKTPLDKLSIQVDEVAALQLMPIDVLEKELLMNKAKHYVPHDLNYYSAIIKAIKAEL